MTTSLALVTLVLVSVLYKEIDKAEKESLKNVETTIEKA